MIREHLYFRERVGFFLFYIGTSGMEECTELMTYDRMTLVLPRLTTLGVYLLRRSWIGISYFFSMFLSQVDSALSDG